MHSPLRWVLNDSMAVMKECSNIHYPFLPSLMLYVVEMANQLKNGIVNVCDEIA